MRHILLLAIFTIIGCAPVAFQVVESTDKMNPGIITYQSNSPVVPDEFHFGWTGITVYAYCYYAVDADSSVFSLLFKFKGTDWAFMEHVRFLIDGRISDCEPIEPPRRDVLSGSSIKEYMWIVVPEGFYEDIQRGCSVSMRVSGRNIMYDKDFTPAIIERFNNFYMTVKEKVAEHTTAIESK